MDYDRQMDEQTYGLGMDKCVYGWMNDVLCNLLQIKSMFW